VYTLLAGDTSPPSETLKTTLHPKSIYIHLQLFENNILKKTIQNFGWYIYNGISISSVICNNISLPSVIICGHQDNGI
jgi:hypothetical protein